MSDWCTIESDPGVFTSLIESFGVRNAQLTELWSLDDDSLQHLVNEYNKVYGLIFLFKWQSSASSHGGADGSSDNKPLSSDEIPHDLFFAKQVTTNACATQAILSVLFNANTIDNNDENDEDEKKLFLGTTLDALKSFTSSFPADLKGEAIGASDEIRNAHNSFARKEVFLMDERKKRIATDDDDVFHFIAYVPKHDMVYELDGLQSGPIPNGTFANNNVDGDMAWLQVARTAIQKRIQKYAATEIKFNLMALTADKRVGLQSKIDALLQSGTNEGDEAIVQLQLALANEEETRNQWKEENERRRHNYLPFCVELIRALSGSGKLPEFTEKAKDRVKQMKNQMKK